MSSSVRKIRLLFVIGQFVQGGSERYLFEVCKALDKARFDIEILTYTHTSPIQYYYPQLTALGITIHRMLPWPIMGLKRSLPSIYRWPPYQELMNWTNTLRQKLALGHFFDSYDLVNIIQIENYYSIQRLFHDNSRLVIYLMSNRFQYNGNDIYAHCLPERHYRFVLMDPAQIDEIRDSPCAHARTIYFPLALDCRARQPVYTPPPTSGPRKIGVFMRLSPERPIEFLFYAFQSLAHQLDVTLHIYGAGDPTVFAQTLDRLHILGKVFFEGHRENLEQTLKQDHLALVWMTSNDRILGYASIEIASFGVPMVFWNLHTAAPGEILAQTCGAIHSYTTVMDFVQHSADILAQPERMRSLGQQLREYILAEHDIVKHIHILEDYYIKLVHSLQKGDEV